MFKKKVYLFVAFLLVLLFIFESVDATWWNADFLKRHPIYIQNNGLQNSNYSIKLNITFNTNMSAFKDLRFTDNSNNELGYWIEYNISNLYADVWVRYPPDLSNTTNTTLYLYYANTSLVNTTSDGENAFLDWHGAASSDFLDAFILPANNIIFHAKVNSIDDGAWGLSNTSVLFSDDCLVMRPLPGSSLVVIYTCNDGTKTQVNVGTTFSPGSYFINFSFDGVTFRSYFDGVAKGTSTTNIPDEKMGIYYNSVGGTSSQYYSFVRKYNTVEPIYYFGPAEEFNVSFQAITILSPLNTTYPTQNIPLNWTANFNISWAAYSLDGGTNISLVSNTTINNVTHGFHNLTVYANDTTGVLSLSSVYFSTDLFALTAATFSNYTTYGGTDYADTLFYNYSAYCAEFGNTTYVNITANNATVRYDSVPCDAANHVYNGTYRHSSETNVTVKIELLTTNNLTIDSSAQHTYRSDITAPTGSIAHNFTYGFLATYNDTVNFTASDSISPAFNCTISMPGNTSNVTFFSGQTRTNNFNRTDAINFFYIFCTDLVGHTSNTTNSETIYTKQIILIEEETGNIFNSFNNMTTLRAISEYQDTIYDFLAANKTSVYYITNATDSIRIDKTYIGLTDTLFIDLDVALIPSPARVCVAKPQQFYEILFYSSSSSKEVAVLNNLANCYILAGKTRYAYSDAFDAKAFSINALYYLFTYSSGTQIFLSSIDGSATLSSNIDILEFNRRAYNLGTKSEDLVISRGNSNNGLLNDTLVIYYFNTQNNNDAVTLTIYNGTTSIFSSSAADDPDEFIVFFDSSSLGNISDILRIVVTATRTDGTTATIERLFSKSGQSSATPPILTPTIALMVSFFLMFFALTFVSMRYAFGWFGIIAVLISLAILTLTPATAPVRLFQVINIIILIYIFIIMKEETGGAV